MPTRDDPDRRWIAEIAELGQRAARAAREDHSGERSSLDALLRDALAICATLLRELVGARLVCTALAEQVSTEQAGRDHLFAAIPAACVCTDRDGSILIANESAAVLLNTSTRGLIGRLLQHFTQDRAQFEALLRMPRDGEPPRGTLSIRPRERAAIAVEAVLTPWTPGSSESVLWFLIPVAHGAIAKRASDRRQSDGRDDRAARVGETADR